MSRFLLFFSIFLALFASFVTSSSSTNNNHFYQNECLRVPIPEFIGSLKSTIDIIRDVTSTISNFGNFFGDLRLSNAVNDCLDLMDFSADELSWSISASQNPKGKNNSTGNLGSDLKTWLSAAMVNQDTCIDGFDGTNGILKNIVSSGLNQITSLVQQLLSQVDSKPSSNTFKTSSKTGKFPSWFKREDRKLLLINGVTPNVVVAADGSGNFSTISEAIKAAPDYSLSRHVIYVKKGVYKENVEIKKKKWNLMIIGDGMGVTVVSGNRNFIDGWTTFRSATFAVSGRGFIARDITFENTAGPEKHQAVALRSDSDLSVFYRCEMKGYQDTLYTHTMRQFYRECKISGTVDFIFGDATAVFQNCQILAKKGLQNQKNTITAHGRKDPNQPTGYSIQFCNITADADLVPAANATYTFLGRPWKNFSRTVVMKSYMSDAIRPEGWLEWNGNMYLDTLYYGEYLNYGPGAGQGKRVKWAGYHIFNTSNEANNFTVSQFIEGNLWLPSTGVRYTAGLDV